MSLAQQGRAFRRQVSAFNKDLFGSDENDAPLKASYNRGEREGIEIYYQFVKRRYWTREAGAIEQQGAIVRWAKWDGNAETKAIYDFVPELQKEITFTDATGRELTFVIEDFLGAHHASVEWVLGCRLST